MKPENRLKGSPVFYIPSRWIGVQNILTIQPIYLTGLGLKVV